MKIVEYIRMTEFDNYGGEIGYIPPILYGPDVIDIEITGDCDYRCPGCWGTKSTEKELSVNQWLDIVDNLDSLGDSYTSRVVITGGEPLIRKDLGRLVCGLVAREKDISLSTTGLDYHHQLSEVVPNLSTIGLPVDGPTPGINSLWRRSRLASDGGLSVSIDALKLIQKINPDLQTSVRTLIHPENVNSITQIPEFLEGSGIDIARLRWILYELNTRKVLPNQSDRLLTSSGVIASNGFGEDEFQTIIEDAGSKFREVLLRKIGNLAGRYFIINPVGECRTVMPFRQSNDTLVEMEVGNIHDSFDDVIQTINEDVGVIGALSEAARLSPAYYYHLVDNDLD